MLGSQRSRRLNPFQGAPIGAIQRGREGEGFRKKISLIFLPGMFIFLYSAVLEAIQFFLPYRTFNVYDVVANGVGVVLFVVFVGVGGTVLRKDFSLRSK